MNFAEAWTLASTKTMCWCYCSSNTSATSTPVSPRVFYTGSFAPTGHNEIAQGRAQRHPGYTGDLRAPPPQFAQALKGRNITHGFTRRRFRPFRAWVVSCTPIPGRRFALPWAITLRPVGAAGLMVDRAITKAEQPTRSVVRSAVHGLPVF